MTTQFKVGDEVAKVGIVKQVQKSDKIAPYLVQFNDGDTDWCREGKLTAIDATPAAPVPPEWIEINGDLYAVKSLKAAHIESQWGDTLYVFTDITDITGQPLTLKLDYNLPHIKAFYEWWQSNTVMRFVPEATDETEADNG